MKGNSRKKVTLSLLGISVTVVLIVFVFNRSNQQVFESVSAERGDITREVLVTGRVKPIESVDLAFERGGKVSRVLVPVGAKVSQGQPLVGLDTAELSAQLLEAQAGMQSQAAKLDGLKRGTRPEELSIKEADLKKAQDDLTSYYLNVPSTLRDAYAKADDAVRSKTDAMFTNDDTSSPQLTFNVTDAQAQIDSIAMRQSSGYELTMWKAELESISATSSPSDIDLVITKSQGHIRAASDFLSRMLEAVNSATGLAPATGDTYKANISTGRTNVNAALTSVNTEQQTILRVKNTVSSTERELALARAGSTPDQVASQEALVKQAEAQVQSIEVQISKSTILSPISGTVTRQDAKLGQIAAPNVPIVSVISERSLEIEANVPEIDVGRVAIGNPVRITIDAFPGETFMGKILQVDPGETIIDGVVNFKVTVAFDVQDERVKTGLTSNLRIETLRKSGIVVIPQFAVIENEKGTFVGKVSGKTFHEEQVVLGIKGQDGNVEVVSGVEAGEVLVNVKSLVAK